MEKVIFRQSPAKKSNSCSKKDGELILTGTELKKVRTELRLTVTDVARMTGLSRNSIYNIEKDIAAEKNYLYLELFYDRYRFKEMTRIRKELGDR